MKKAIKQFIVYILISFLSIYSIANLQEKSLKLIGGFSTLIVVLYISNKIAKWLTD
jgi:hypothetical protein